MSNDWNVLINVIKQAEQQHCLHELLDLLFSDAEKGQINTRLEIITALTRNDKSQREIAKNLSVSIAKITRGSNHLKHISPKLRQFLVTMDNSDSERNSHTIS
jgi:TrpR family trp operon transcriptional repressor